MWFKKKIYHQRKLELPNNQGFSKTNKDVNDV